MIGSFVRGVLDGSLSTLGIVIGASAGSPTIVIAASAGGALANGISNALSAYSAEEARMSVLQREVDSAMVARGPRAHLLQHRLRIRRLQVGAVDGLGTALGGAVPIIPFLFLPSFPAMLLSIGLVMALVLIVGVYLGRLSRQNMLLSGLKMALFAGLVAGVVYLVQLAIVPE